MALYPFLDFSYLTFAGNTIDRGAVSSHTGGANEGAPADYVQALPPQPLARPTSLTAPTKLVLTHNRRRSERMPFMTMSLANVAGPDLPAGFAVGNPA